MKPILFNTEMVRAILEGRKTVTRRAMKPQPDSNTVAMRPTLEGSCYLGYFECLGSDRVHKPPYQTGDILYVRETWDNILMSPDRDNKFGGVYYYKADGDQRPEGWQRGWRPSIHMPKDAARLFLIVRGVRAEKLKSATRTDAKREGLANPATFDSLWNSTIKPADREKYGWDADPWVWVIEFNRVAKPN